MKNKEMLANLKGIAGSPSSYGIGNATFAAALLELLKPRTTKGD